MDRAGTRSLSPHQSVVLTLLLAFAAAGWAVLAWQSPGGDGGMAMKPLTMGMRAPVFLLMWVIMMVAMMFPTAAPMILTFHRVQAQRRRLGEAFVSTSLFVAAYLLVWSLAGIAAFAAALAAEAMAGALALAPAAAARIGGGALIAAGLYQLTPLKDLCLSKCRSPISFIMTSWRDGAWGALRMGLSHGGWCLGCCWLLFVILFPLGIMNAAAMAAVTLVIFAEKSLPRARAAVRATAAALIAYGAAVIASPGLLPTYSAGPGADMPMAMPNSTPN